MRVIITFSILISCANLFAQGQIINVPDDQATIQGAIDSALDGDTVLVAEGTYYENIKFKGKAITVASWFLTDGNEAHIDNTIIDGSQRSHPDSGSVVSFISGEDTTSVLYGFTITGGSGTLDPDQGHLGGGGIIVGLSGAKIRFNKIIKNIVTRVCPAGGGIVIFRPSNPVIILNNYIAFNEAISSSCTNGAGGMHIFHDPGIVLVAENIITNNVTYSPAGAGGGGGIMLQHSSSVIRNNIVAYNHAYRGGGIDIYDGENLYNPTIINNTIVYNTATNNGGGIKAKYDNPIENPLRNCIIWGNTAPIDPQISKIGTTGPGRYDLTAEYSVIEGSYEGIGNIDMHPLFADTINYYLDSSSPCIDAGNPDTIYNDIEDPDNQGTALYPALGGLRNDIGTYGGNPEMALILVPELVIKDIEISGTYFLPGIDTVIVTSIIDIPDEQQVSVSAVFENKNVSFSDSVSMNDDGLGCDETANDRIFTGYWPTFAVEDHYFIRISVYLTEYEKYIKLRERISFTTMGPLVFESIESTSGNENPSPPVKFTFSLTLKNEAKTDTVHDVSVKLTTPDYPHIVNSTLGVPKFDDIAPGKSQTSYSRDFSINFYDGCVPGEYDFGLEINSDGETYWYDTLVIEVEDPSDIEDEQTDIPTEFSLEQNYPNPFNPATTIDYSIPHEVKSEWSKVSLKIYDVLGKEVATLVNEYQRSGSYTVNFEASALSSGVYFYKLITGKHISVRKMLVIK